MRTANFEGEMRLGGGAQRAARREERGKGGSGRAPPPRPALPRACLLRWLSCATLPKSTYAMRPSGSAKMLPGCGSPWKRPNSSSCRRPETTPQRMKASTEMPDARMASGSVHRTPLIHSMTMTLGEHRSRRTQGILTDGSFSKLRPKSWAAGGRVGCVCVDGCWRDCLGGRGGDDQWGLREAAGRGGGAERGKDRPEPPPPQMRPPSLSLSPPRPQRARTSMLRASCV